MLWFLGTVDAVPRGFHNQVTFGDNLIKGSRKIEGTDVSPNLVLKRFDYLKVLYPWG